MENRQAKFPQQEELQGSVVPVPWPFCSGLFLIANQRNPNTNCILLVYIGKFGLFEKKN
jgi:hypothetical protein